MPTFSTLSSMSAKSLGQTTSLNREFDDGSWITSVSYPGTPATTRPYLLPPNSISVDTSNNKLYMVGSHFTPIDSDYKWAIMSFNLTTGELLNYKVLDWIDPFPPTDLRPDLLYVSKVISDGSLYVGGTGSWNYLPQLYKLNSTLTAVTQSREVAGPYQGGYISGINIDSSSNIYISGTVYLSPGLYEIFLMKYDSSLNLLWKRKVGTTGSEWSASGSVLGVNNKTFIGVDSYPSGQTYSNANIVCYSDSGTIQWQRQIQDTSSGNQPTKNFGVRDLVSGLSDGVVAIAVAEDVTVGSNIWQKHHIFKYNNGTVEWKKVINTLYQESSSFSSISKDSSGNFYVSINNLTRAFINNAALGGTFPTILKIDTNGNLLHGKTIRVIYDNVWKYSYLVGFQIIDDQVCFAFHLYNSSTGSSPDLGEKIIVGKIPTNFLHTNGIYNIESGVRVIIEPMSSSFSLSDSPLYEFAGSLTDAANNDNSLQPISYYNNGELTLSSFSTTSATIR